MGLCGGVNMFICSQKHHYYETTGKVCFISLMYHFVMRLSAVCLLLPENTAAFMLYSQTPGNAEPPNFDKKAGKCSKKEPTLNTKVLLYPDLKVVKLLDFQLLCSPL
ncbi:hypothetical protein ILYODFUR_026737 [Ilyodon furcidens]|uniref:Uncharacterized protein n=1 Tax=Ilyodon furcidens TaxID=33524 RepID=A0ABV0TXY5_9TELE